MAGGLGFPLMENYTRGVGVKGYLTCLGGSFWCTVENGQS